MAHLEIPFPGKPYATHDSVSYSFYFNFYYNRCIFRMNITDLLPPHTTILLSFIMVKKLMTMVNITLDRFLEATIVYNQSSGQNPKIIIGCQGNVILSQPACWGWIMFTWVLFLLKEALFGMKGKFVVVNRFYWQISYPGRLPRLILYLC